jgi:hypothetical protein
MKNADYGKMKRELEAVLDKIARAQVAGELVGWQHVGLSCCIQEWLPHVFGDINLVAIRELMKIASGNQFEDKEMFKRN